MIFKVDFLNKSKITSQHFAIFFKLKLLKKYFRKKKISLKILKFDILFSILERVKMFHLAFFIILLIEPLKTLLELEKFNSKFAFLFKIFQILQDISIQFF